MFVEKTITKEVFTQVLEDVKMVSDYQDHLNAFFKKNDVDGYIFQPDCTCSVLQLLHFIFGERDVEEWISYFCFELDFGRKYKDGMVTDKDGKNIPLGTIGDLYNVLTM